MATIHPSHAKQPFEIHHDAAVDEPMSDEDQPMDEDDVSLHEQDVEEDGYSETSEESDGVVDMTVQEDMDKFQETFKGIKDRFRLINRIGEG